MTTHICTVNGIERKGKKLNCSLCQNHLESRDVDLQVTEELKSAFEEMERNHGWIPEHKERVLEFIAEHEALAEKNLIKKMLGATHFGYEYLEGVEKYAEQAGLLSLPTSEKGQ